MRILGLDPGPTQSALVLLGDASVLGHWIEPNSDILLRVMTWANVVPVLVVEQIHAMGMAVGESVFETVWWSGRFAQAWQQAGGREAFRVKRHAVKSYLCHNQRAKDANIRQALIDRFGGESGIRKKAHPGPLYGLKGDEWSALAVAVTWHAQHASTGLLTAREGSHD